MNQVHDAIGEVGREVRAVVGAAVFAQAASHVHAGKALGQGELHVRVSFRVFPSAFVKVGGDPRAQVLGLADVNDFAFGVLVEVDAGGSGQAADFLREIHGSCIQCNVKQKYRSVLQ